MVKKITFTFWLVRLGMALGEKGGHPFFYSALWQGTLHRLPSPWAGLKILSCGGPDQSGELKLAGAAK